MIYRPIASRSMWDSWILPWNNEYHLFHLESQDGVWSHVGRAVSSDLVHWQPLPSIPTRNSQPHWNSDVTLTGSVVAHDGKFYMFVGSIVDAVQVVGVYISDDLEHWQPYPKNPIIRPAGPHYLSDPAKAGSSAMVDWRDPNVTYNPKDGYYHAVTCAHLPEWDKQYTGAAVGHIRSKDLIHWEHLPPIAAPQQFYHLEAPDVFELNGRYYLLFQCHSVGGLRINTPCRDDTVGVYYMSGLAYEGPFELGDNCQLFGSGNGKMEGYAGRTIAYGDQRILISHCHVVNPYRPALGAPKLIQTDSDGSLYLKYMPLLEELETSVVLDSTEAVNTIEPDNDNLGRWQRTNTVITGDAPVTNSALKIADDISDLHIQCSINSSTAKRAGVIVRAYRDNNTMRDAGVAVWLDYEHQELQIAQVGYQKVVGWGFDIHHVMGNSVASYIHDRCRVKLDKFRNYHLRLFVRDEHFEVYLDDRWVFTSVLSKAPKMGSVNLIVERGQTQFSGLRLSRIKRFS